jgi:hypothetical protein
MKTCFPLTLNRLEYLVRLLIFTGIVLFLSFLAKHFGPPIPLWLGIIIICILFVIRFECLDIPRCRSMQWPLWFVLLLIIPMVDIVIQILMIILPAKKANA